MSDPNADYRAFYSRAKDIHMAVSPETGVLLYMLARGNAARTIVEFGTSFGISTIHLAAALRDNGGGRLIGTEFEPSKLAHARAQPGGRRPRRPGRDPGRRRPPDPGAGSARDASTWCCSMATSRSTRGSSTS